ncbi:MAG: hypothetical protein C5B51_04985 [Terriglobia bacterium]|nr:MAG: hypothetical protein C5B51_04985 [Terriglobia bacterium]
MGRRRKGCSSGGKVAKRSKPSGQPVVATQDPIETPNLEQVASLAYHLWQARGCPVGSPDIDWFEAEQQLRSPAEVSGNQQISEPLLVRGSGA